MSKILDSPSSEKEIDYLEEEFLKCDIKDLPFPKEEIKEYEREVIEVMKSGCNRQIAEYVILEYKRQEDEEAKSNKNLEKLSKLREEYDKYKNPIIKKVNEILIEQKNNKEIKEAILEGYEYEIEEIMENDKLKNIYLKENLEIYENNANFYLNKEIEELRSSDENKKKFDEARSKFINKRDAVIESALRKTKEIVNNENAFKIFYKDYYGKEYPEK